MPKRGASALGVASRSIDPTLDALFSASSGPVKAPAKSRYSGLLEPKPKPEPKPRAVLVGGDKGDEQEGDDEVLSEISEELDYSDEDEDGDASETSSEGEDEDEGGDESDPKSVAQEQVAPAAEEAETSEPRRERKRKRKDDNEDLEAKYLAELTKDDEHAPLGKRLRAQQENDGDDDDGEIPDKVPVHESLAPGSNVSEVEKASRTVFLGNVSTDAISSKQAKKTLTTHLSSVLDENDTPPQKLESIRFRSVAFSTGSMPKRAAYITKSLMGATTKSANAYAVFSSPAAARKVVAELNGTEVLDRHIRVDSIAHPSAMDHRRCVFVGNLGFVDDETVLNTDSEGKTVEKKRNKIPSDIEEGLWRTFGKKGKVENVRVVRDPKTRVGKGFAYVQFYDGNDVESALHLDGKKFPPMLPRALRVTRAKDPRKTVTAQERAKARANASKGATRNTMYRPKITPEQQAAAGRAGKLLGRAGAAMHRNKSRSDASSGAHTGMKTPEQIVFEGRRASSRDALSKDLKGKKSKGKPGKPKNRSARRATAWKKKGSA
ncbi:Nucleolar protein 12 [Tolypocladium ophioglossoides CBS 100239]|uniref:Nucleolar protein 12 n=1 Tax=Tolypocladium ophioglossoides (strain CBS 100239) TaxID=1163406 RepID=A0A0L0NNN6_TOLOC|nr:Nucleolar protein 12 [Tolypocladium ophioglossoides CBS 100239]